MEENIELKYFSVAEIRQWLQTGIDANGLSDAIISKSRALSIINNPYVTNEMKVLSTLFINNNVVSFSAIFPDELKRPDCKIYWATTLYVSPKYEGRGFGYCVLASFYDLYKNSYFDMNGVEATVQNFKSLGYQNIYVNKYIFHKFKYIHVHSIKGVLAYCKEYMRSYLLNKRSKNIVKDFKFKNYTVQYVDYIDDVLYNFIEKFSEKDIFLRKRETFNWIIKYPFMISCPLFNRVTIDNRLSSYREYTKMYAVKILTNDEVIGFYIFNVANKCMSVKYIYYNPKYLSDVFCSVYEHYVIMNVHTIDTLDDNLTAYLKNLCVYSKLEYQKVSFSYPKSFKYNMDKCLQGGDSDSFA